MLKEDWSSILRSRKVSRLRRPLLVPCEGRAIAHSKWGRLRQATPDSTDVIIDVLCLSMR